jgi:hypothetical protein
MTAYGTLIRDTLTTVRTLTALTIRTRRSCEKQASTPTLVCSPDMIVSCQEWEDRQSENAVIESAKSIVSPSVEDVADLARTERLK